MLVQLKLVPAHDLLILLVSDADVHLSVALHGVFDEFVDLLILKVFDDVIVVVLIAALPQEVLLLVRVIFLLNHFHWWKSRLQITLTILHLISEIDLDSIVFGIQFVNPK